MPCHSLEDLQAAATLALKEAMANERSRRWSKVVQNYRRLVRMIQTQNLPQSFSKPPWFPKLLYELHYHLGIALQHVRDHHKAARQYTLAIEAVSISKNGCTAGCNANSCLMVPLYARRAFAHAHCGAYTQALSDAEKAAVLDNKNPDVYCIRALVQNTQGNNKEALCDAKIALKLNPNHPCALILHGTLVAMATAWAGEDEGAKKKNDIHPDHIKACNINPDCHNYLSVSCFKHPDILNFYDRFLYSLSIPHTMSEIKFVDGGNPDAMGKYPQSMTSYGRDSRRPGSQYAASTLDATQDGTLSIYSGYSNISGTSGASSTTYRSPMKFLHPASETSSNPRPFRCGTPLEEDKARMITIMRRRKQYGESIRQHASKPRTAEEFMAHLQKRRQKQALLETQLRDMALLSRPKSAPRPHLTEHSQSGSYKSLCLRPHSAPKPTPVLTADKSCLRPKSSAKSEKTVTYADSLPTTCSPSPQPRPRFLSPEELTPEVWAVIKADLTARANKLNGASFHSHMSGGTRDPPKPMHIAKDAEDPITLAETQTLHIPVFQPVNVGDAPRMYYKPWFGDKLPHGEKGIFMEFNPPFKV